MNKLLALIKPYLRWFIFGGTLFFVLKNFKDHWQEVATVRIDSWGWFWLTFALMITLIAHCWSGWVWTWILKAFQQPCSTWWGIRVYLITNIAKYLPGNVWHFYGRISAISQAGGSFGGATLSVLLEPLLMAAAALLIALTSTGLGWLKTNYNFWIWYLQILLLLIVLVGIHPYFLNPLMHYLSIRKKKSQEIGKNGEFDTKGIKESQETEKINLASYPIIPLGGEIGFLIARGIGFVLIFLALHSLLPQQIPSLISAFSIAWLLGLIIPGAPGGMGVFEASAIALLPSSQFPPGIILIVVAFYRLISIVAEVIAAGLAWLSS
jgi:hypothetical protein